MSRLESIAEVVHAVARQEDSELRRFSGKGILHMPELAFVHQVARELSARSAEIFGVPKITWEVNRGVGSGLTDLVIDTQSTEPRNVAIEFKVGGDVRK